MDIVKELLFIFFALGFILVLAWYCIRALKHIKTFNASDNPVNVLAVKPIGQRDRLVVIEYREHEYLLAVSPAGVSVVDKLTAMDEKSSPRHPSV